MLLGKRFNLECHLHIKQYIVLELAVDAVLLSFHFTATLKLITFMAVRVEVVF